MGGGAIGNGADSIAVMRQLQRELKKRRDSKGEVGEDEEVVGWGRAGLCLYIRTYLFRFSIAKLAQRLGIQSQNNTSIF